MTTIAKLLELGSTPPPRALSIGEIGAWWHGGPPIEGDSALPADHWIKFARCSTAAIVGRCRLDRQVVDTLRRQVLDHPLTRRPAGSRRWMPSTADWNRPRPPTFGDLIDCCA